MNVATLHPPNNHLLKDDLVAGVVQCTRRSIANENLSGCTYQSSSAICVPTGNALLQIDSDDRIGSNTSNGNAEISLRNYKKKRMKTTENMKYVTKRNVAELPIEASKSSYKTVAELLKLGFKIEREKRLETQKRYRRRKEESANRLVKDVLGLRDEIKKLELHHRRIYADIPAVDNAWVTVMGYFRVVRHRLPLSTEFIAFIAKTISSDVVYNSQYGIEAMTRSWCFLRWFGDVKEELVNLKKTTANTIEATTRTSVTITQQTLVQVFPHLLRDEDFALRSKLLGQRIVMDGSTCFVWGGTEERVTNVIAQSDMLTPVIRLLENWEQVSWVFEKALISSNFQWRSMPVDKKHLSAGVSQ